MDKTEQDKAFETFCAQKFLRFGEEYKKTFGMDFPFEDDFEESQVLIDPELRILKFCFTDPHMSISDKTHYRLRDVALKAGLYEGAGDPETSKNLVQIRNHRPDERDFVVTVAHFDSVDDIVRERYLETAKKP